MGLKNISIRTGLLTLLLLTTLLLLIVSSMGVIAIKKDRETLAAQNQIQGIELGNLMSGYNQTLNARASATLAVRKIEIGLLDDGARETSSVEKHLRQSEADIERAIKSVDADPKRQALAQEVLKTYQAYFQQGMTPMLIALQKQYTDEYYDVLEKQLGPLSEAFDVSIQNFRQYAQQLSEQGLAQSEYNERMMLLLIAIASLLSITLVALSWVALRHMLLKPLDYAIAQLEQVAAGNLTNRLMQGGNNELGRLNDAIGRMQSALLESVSQVRDASTQIDLGSRELFEENSQLSLRTEESVAALEQTVASMEQLSATVKLNADHAELAHQLANNVSNTSSRSNESVCYVIEKMQEIATSAKRINDILSVIDGIAFQTNILALNASVESARAGEQGRGFAVVAGEVRNLAQHSAQAAKEIRSLIVDSQTRVSEGLELASKAGETMDEVTDEIVRITQLMRDISTATQEQHRGIEQVNVAFTQIDKVAQHNAQLVKASSATTQSLEQQSQQLMRSMSLFQVEPRLS
ncbi:methyl-accepting chemotaxis protein [Pectobacterium parmentieri]|uniref:Methyl-accepting chemotaxis protein n=1 Tax=Pectobacterium parmentieri TaxID=1905730 RepID=A0A8B3FFP2_PECPM|nr:methyl-accepting chemotaxis protein [Pectobacterium parmentieri]AOR57421.1 chemotaxis protein [Pectobacterium parmentieri]AYH11538.1 methyl-accepting chemotaxis protein [Pectobacterium parmentieri]AYH17745.1 methyl-accepting chemotaxis protein [Pectobacterium parmentieri]AYH37818.1 methyl-accepting chemotaxis protein [Pectobacterium parmentieri]AZS58049.1 methyl-accepting chemotaxis protein [Pectobacterium parmentieri]